MFVSYVVFSVPNFSTFYLFKSGWGTICTLTDHFVQYLDMVCFSDPVYSSFNKNPITVARPINNAQWNDFGSKLLYWLLVMGKQLLTNLKNKIIAIFTNHDYYL